MNKLKETTLKFPQTEIWNDSCSCKELAYAVEQGACGATTNPIIVKNVLKNELSQWEEKIHQVIQQYPYYSEDEVAWEMIKQMGQKASLLLLDQFIASNGQTGRISFQTNAKFYRNTKRMVQHGLILAAHCDNSQVKAPASKAGIAAYEELTYQGVSINATVSFSVAQAIQTAEAVERGLCRRMAEGLDITRMHPVCTIMAGRLDDYLKQVVEKESLLFDPEPLQWAGVAVVKEALRLYEINGYKTKLLVAAFRNPYHWSYFVGENIVLTIPNDWQKKIGESSYEVSDHHAIQVEEKYLNQLHQLEEFNKAFYVDGLKLEEFETYGPFITAITQFLSGYDELVQLIRSYMIQEKTGG